MRRHGHRTDGYARRGAITAIELVVVVLILGLLAVLAIPRSSKADDRTPHLALRADLTLLRTAIALYYEDHGAYPGGILGGAAAGDAPSAERVVQQLTMCSDAAGSVAGQRSATHPFGPYLRKGVPAATVGRGRGSSTLALVGSSAGETAGWLYDPQTGHISVNADGVDALGVPYADY